MSAALSATLALVGLGFGAIALLLGFLGRTATTYMKLVRVIFALISIIASKHDFTATAKSPALKSRRKHGRSYGDSTDVPVIVRRKYGCYYWE